MKKIIFKVSACALALSSLALIGGCASNPFSTCPSKYCTSPSFLNPDNNYHFPPLATSEKTTLNNWVLRILISSQDALNYKLPHRENFYKTKFVVPPSNSPGIQYGFKDNFSWSPVNAKYHFHGDPTLTIHKNLLSAPEPLKEKIGSITVSIISSSKISSKWFKEIFDIDFAANKKQPILDEYSYFFLPKNDKAAYEEIQAYIKKLQNLSFKCTEFAKRPVFEIINTYAHVNLLCDNNNSTPYASWGFRTTSLGYDLFWFTENKNLSVCKHVCPYQWKRIESNVMQSVE
jgi:hypothetical protein